MFLIPKTMRAAVYRGIDDIRLETVPVPRIAADELLVKVAACGVCPTDIKKIHYGLQPPPRIYGHETAGTIVKAGRNVQGWRVGDRVALHHHVPCLTCHACRHRSFAQCPGYKRTGVTAGFEPAGGGFAEYVRVMAFALPGVVKIPSVNSFEEAALLEPVNTVLKAVLKLNLIKGDTALVVGQGPIGLMFTRLLHLRGIHVVASDLLDHRLKLARRMGAHRAWRGDHEAFEARVLRITRGRGVDAVVLAVPSDSILPRAQKLTRGGGRILLFADTRRGGGVPLELASICMDEKDLLGSYSSDFTLQKEAARLVFQRKMDVRPLISHRFELADTAQAVRLAAEPAGNSLKIVVSPNVR